MRHVKDDAVTIVVLRSTAAIPFARLPWAEAVARMVARDAQVSGFPEVGRPLCTGLSLALALIQSHCG